MSVVLGIETSCDETSASVVEGGPGQWTVRSLVILSQDIHSVFGGVVPEIASRAHLTAIVPVVTHALTEAGASLGEIDAIAVTHAPGLVGALLVGVSYAKGLAAASGRPIIGVHHMEGHLFATSLEHPDATPPFTALLVSGGHTMLLDVPAWGDYRWLGGTRDDAAGEAFDKVGKLLGLPYPGGPHIERLARDGDPARFRFSRPMLRRDQQPGDIDYYDLSFSGLKTAVRLAVEASPDLEADRAHLARGFQDAVIDTLTAKVVRACRAHDRTRVVLGGGVACNRTLVTALAHELDRIGGRVFAPTARLATDNAAMIAAAGAWRVNRGEADNWTLNAYAQRDIPGLTGTGR
ncbi:MAG: tRNA (adenosine(37)-N6)-threonylcarbamoyltransferase complex transferase subunit TsaD [Gemmatimonadetes bacterium]|nr:tRNA (adenosine(37)-N6)-threonylcarbamoyltransferase complex transferase subunit TsaD [Gemmatimonadota bacterium]